MKRNTALKVKRRGVILGVILLVLVGGALNYMRQLNVAAHAVSFDDLQTSHSQITWPASTEAAVAADGYGVLAVHGPQTSLPIASIAKVITSLAILEQKPLSLGQQGPTMTIGPNDVDRYLKYAVEGGSVLPVTLGEKLTERQVLQGMLLASANNLADAAAIWAFGSLPNYVSFANQMLQRLGLTHTVVADDASGFLSHTVSTASDLVRIGLLVMQNPALADIVNEQTAALPQAGTVHNLDTLLGNNGVVGIKTGSTDEAGGCFLLAAHYTPANGKRLTIITAVVGAVNLDSALQESQSLLLSARQNFSTQTYAHAGQVLATYNLPWGGTVHAVAANDIQPTLWNGASVKAITNFKDINGAMPKDTKVGTVTLTSGDATFTYTVRSQQDVTAPGFWWRVFRGFY